MCGSEPHIRLLTDERGAGQEEPDQVESHGLAELAQLMSFSYCGRIMRVYMTALEQVVVLRDLDTAFPLNREPSDF